MNNKKEIGYRNEEIVKQYYIDTGYEVIEKNYTIRGGEIDLLMKKGNELIIIEVKTVNNIDELDNYITERKIGFLQRSLESFLQDSDEDWIEDIRMDVVFVKDGKILEIFEDITNK